MAEKSPMELMLESMAGFGQSVKEYAAANALSNATEQMNQIKTQITDENEQRVQLQSLGSDLALKLGALGKDANEIKTAFAAVAPAQASTIQEGLMSDSAAVRQRAMDAQTKAQQAELAQMEARANAGQQILEGKEQRKYLSQAQTGFNRFLKDRMAATNSAKNAYSLLSSNSPYDQKAALMAIPVLMARASGEVGNLSQSEQAQYKGARDLWSQFKQLTSEKAQGQFIRDNRTILAGLAKKYMDMSDTAINEMAVHYGGQLNQQGLFGAIDDEEMAKKIYPKYKSASKATSSNPISKYVSFVEPQTTSKSQAPALDLNAGQQTLQDIEERAAIQKQLNSSMNRNKL